MCTSDNLKNQNYDVLTQIDTFLTLIRNIVKTMDNI